MRMRALLSILTVLVVLTVAYAASNVDGTWTGQRPGRDGNMMPVTFKFKAEGDKLTGSTSMRQRTRGVCCFASARTSASNSSASREVSSTAALDEFVRVGGLIGLLVTAFVGAIVLIWLLRLLKRA